MQKLSPSSFVRTAQLAPCYTVEAKHIHHASTQGAAAYAAPRIWLAVQCTSKSESIADIQASSLSRKQELSLFPPNRKLTFGCDDLLSLLVVLHFLL